MTNREIIRAECLAKSGLTEREAKSILATPREFTPVEVLAAQLVTVKVALEALT